VLAAALDAVLDAVPAAQQDVALIGATAVGQDAVPVVVQDAAPVAEQHAAAAVVDVVPVAVDVVQQQQLVVSMRSPNSEHMMQPTSIILCTSQRIQDNQANQNILLMVTMLLVL